MSDVDLEKVCLAFLKRTGYLTEYCFKMTMSSNRFFYMSSSSVFRSQFKRLEPLNVQSVEKHETADAGLFVDFERCSGKNDSLQIDSI